MVWSTPACVLAEPVTAFGLTEVQPRQGLPNVLRKLKAGEEVHVAYLGGSITAAPGWRVLSLDWLKSQYPQAKLSEINAAISGTPSSFGALRLEREVLKQKPDLLFVEFAVNDGGSNPTQTRRAMEGIVRQTWRSFPQTDICFVYTLGDFDLPVLKSGKLQVSAMNMEQVAAHYGIPSIHFGIEVARLHEAGKLIFTAPLPKTDEEKKALGDKIVFAGDAVHPHVATGHPLYLAAIQRSWPSIVEASKGGDHMLTEPMDPLAWEKGHLIPFAEVGRGGDWKQLPPGAPPLKSAGTAGARMWTSGKAGSAIHFKFKGRLFGLYALKGPDAGKFKVTVDDQAPVEAAQFDSYCTSDRWRISPWMYPAELPDTEHRVTIELLGTTPDKEAILKPKNGAITSAEQREATNLHVCDIMILGDFLPEVP